MTRVTETPRAQLEGVTKRFGTTEVLTDISLQIHSGEVVALVGPSGSGKTTIGRIIAGFEPSTHGSVHIDGTLVDGRGTWVPPQRRSVGVVPQEGALFPHLTVARNIAAGIPRSERSTVVPKLLQMIGLEEHASKRPHQLSGGQRQRVALARALAPQPKLIILDEPFSALDPGLRSQLRADVLRLLRAANMTALVITHDQDEALSIADRVAVLVEGRLLQMDTPRTVYERPASLEVAHFIGDANELSATVTNGSGRSELGVSAVIATSGDSVPDGPAALIVRPEQIEIGSEGVMCSVTDVVYLGHVVALHLALPSGQTITARVPLSGARGSLAIPQVGDETQARIDGPVVAFEPRDPN